MTPRCEVTGEPQLFCHHCDTARQLADDDRVQRTIAQLRRIPNLATLVTIADDAPVRTPTGKTKAAKATSSPIPTKTAARDLLNTTATQLEEAVRVVAEHQRQTLDTWPDLADPPTLAGDCGYLLEATELWEDDDFTRQWVTTTAHKVHEALSRWVGEQIPRPPVYRCPKCNGKLRLGCYSATGEGSQLACADCHHIYHPADIAHIGTITTPTPLPDIAAWLNLTERTLQRWASAHLFTPVTTHTPSPKRPALYLPSDVQRVASMVRAG